MTLLFCFFEGSILEGSCSNSWSNDWKDGRYLFELSRTKLSSGFMTLQVVMNQIIGQDGGDDFQLGHIGKARLKRLGQLPLRLDVHEEAADWDVVADDGDDRNSEEENERNDPYCTF
jgi:hypothetical protein